MKRLLMLAVFTLISSVTASAQTCLGTLSFQDAQTQIGGGVFFKSNAFGVNAGAARGNSQWFGRGGVGIDKISDLDGLAKNLFVTAGGNLAVGPDQKYAVCPIVGLFHRFGPGYDDVSTSGNIITGGAAIGFVARENGTTEIIPTVAAAITHGSESASGDLFDVSFSETYLGLSLGVGIVLDKRTAVTPSVVIPIGSDAESTLFQVTVSRKFGQ